MTMKLLMQTKKVRDSKITLVSSMFSIIQLTHKLKFRFARQIYHPIFVVLCKLISTCFSLFKIWFNENNNKKNIKKIKGN